VLIVITGSESFVGKELIKQMKTKDVEIIGIDSTNSDSQDYKFHRCDIRSKEIEKIIPENADAIIHLAAISTDPICKKNPYECFDVNVMGTLNIIKFSKLRNVKQVIFASSEWVYENFEEGEEKDESSFINITKHTSEYALSKLISENNLRQQFKNGFCPVTILRFGIIYGPRKTNWSAVESIFNKIKNESEVTIGSLKNGRRFVHVSDIVEGIISSISLEGFNIINLTGNEIITLGDIIEIGQKILMKKIRIKEISPDVINIRNPSNLKAKKILNWEPKINLEKGLKTILPFI
jgi:UDP-glucose 4-epimerase